MEEVAAELDPVIAAIERDVVVDLEVGVVPVGEYRWFAHRAVEPAG